MRAVIAEDDVLLAEGLTLLLSRAGFEVVGRARDGDTFLDAVVRHRPDVAVVDVRMPPSFRDEGIRAAIASRRLVPGLPVVVLSQYVEVSCAAELLTDAHGGTGYLLKDRVGKVQEFIDALTKVASGGTVIDPEVIQKLLTLDRTHPVDGLTPREREVLALMAEGHDNATIRARLYITESSVQKHIGSIFSKLGLQQARSGNRRVRAVLAYLGHAGRSGPTRSTDVPD